jgi:hypothetical protein
MVFSIRRCSIVVSYLRQVAICEPIRGTIKQALSRSDDVGVRLIANTVPTNESVLRAVSLNPGLDTEDKLKDFMFEYILGGLRLTERQREQLSLNG